MFHYAITNKVKSISNHLSSNQRDSTLKTHASEIYDFHVYTEMVQNKELDKTILKGLIHVYQSVK